MHLVTVTIGGVTVPYGTAVSALAILAASRTSAIAPVLRAARNPLAACDYFGTAAPYLSRAKSAPKTGRAGAAGRHVTKHAFAEAVAVILAGARAHAVAAALASFGADERYATAMAADAVELKRREHSLHWKKQAEGAIAAAMAQCALTGGECALESPCGTGQCRFAPGWLSAVTAPAIPGRLRRPPCHARAGEGFSAAPAVAAAVALVPFRPMVTVSDNEMVHTAEAAA